MTTPGGRGYNVWVHRPWGGRLHTGRRNGHLEPRKEASTCSDGGRGLGGTCVNCAELLRVCVRHHPCVQGSHA